MTDAIKPPSEVVAEDAAFERALAAYNQVWKDWPDLTASNADECRRASLRAALTANTPVGEPVAFIERDVLPELRKFKYAQATVVSPLVTKPFGDKVALYTYPPVAVGADEIMRALCHSCDLDLDQERRMADHGHTPSQHFLDEWQRYTTAILALLSGEKPLASLSAQEAE